jgi:hypothetical protein
VTPTIDSILALLQIMLDEKEIHEVRLDAAEQILTYEAPEEAATAARDYLIEVFNNKKLTSTMRLAAIKLMRKSEARKITKPSVKPEEGFANRMENARRRLAERGPSKLS